MPYANDLDLVGKNSRQRKVRQIWQEVREHDAVVLTLLKGMGYTVDKEGRLVGDYGWELREGSWLRVAGFASTTLERKTLADLRDTARLRKQLDKMRHFQSLAPAGFGNLFVVLIEHTFDTDRKRRWPEESILNAELSIQLGGVMVTRCAANDVASRIHSLYQWSQKKTHQLAGGD